MRTALLAVMLGVLPAQDRAPVPPDADLRAAEKIVRDVFRQGYASKDPAARRAMARQMLDQAPDPKNDPATRFVLYREAREQAAAGGDAALGLLAIDEAASRFELDAGALKLAHLEKASKAIADPGEARTFGDACLAVAADRTAVDDYDRALKALQLADGAARAAKDAGFAAQVKARMTELAALKTEYAKAKPAEKTLQDKPGDAAASGLVGRFRCYLKRDWERGLPLLAAGPEGAAKALAATELLKPSTPPEQAGLGAGWAALALEQTGAARASLLEHAASWYAKAWPGADESLKASLREKLKAALGKASGKAVSPLPPPWEWVGMLKPVLDETYARTGTFSVRVPPAQGPMIDGGVASPRFPAKPGDEFTLSGWVLSDGNAASSDPFRVDFYSAANVFLSGDGPGVPKDQPYWTFVKHTVVCPADTASVRLICFRPSRAGGVWLDDLSLRKTGDGRELIRNGSFEER